MAESLRDLVVSLSLNTDNFTRNIKSVNKQIQEAESYFKLAASGLTNFESSVAGLQSKMTMLQRKLELQRNVVTQYEKALTAANAKLQETYARQQDYGQRLDAARERQSALREEVNHAAVAYEHYKNTLGETDSATIAAASNLEAAEREYEEANEDVTRLAGQCNALKKSTQNAADAVSTAQTQLNRAQAAVRDTSSAIDQCNKQLRTAQSEWTAAGKALTKFSEEIEKISNVTGKIGKTLTATLTTPIVALGTTAVKSSIEFELAFAGVRKTVDATEGEFTQLEDAVKRMSTEIAADTTEIANVMAVAGQLGIDTSALEDFTRVMIDLGNSTDIVAEEAASTLAKFANIMDMDQFKFQNLGSTLVDLGNNYATTESAIMEMSMRLAGAGKQIGLSEAQILGFATALSSVGIEAQMGGSALSKALIKMEVAAATGGEALTDFATVCGMTEDQFKQMWEADPAAVFQAFIEGLAQMDDEGMSAIAVLNDIGIAEVRLRDTLLRSVNATELFSKTQQTANAAWQENTALATEAGKRYATTESQLVNLKNKAMLFAQQLGDDLNPTVQKLIGGIDELLERFLSMDESQRKQLIQTAAFVAAIGPAFLAISKLTKGLSTITGALGKFCTAVGAAGGGFKGFLSVLGKSPAVWAAVAVAVIAGTVALVDYASGAKEAREALEGMNETAQKWKDTAAETFYSKSNGLAFFGMSKDDFVREKGNIQEWLDGLIAVWSDGEKESNEIVDKWTDSFKALTESTRAELQSLKETAEKGGYSSVADSLNADIALLDSLDAEIEALLKKRQNGYFSDKDKIRLQELIDTREGIEIKYHLTPADADGFETIRQKLEAEVARAQARGQSDADVKVYENAIVAAAEGMAALNAEIDAQYDKEYAVIQMIEDSAERQAALDALNAEYLEKRRAAAQEYAETLAAIVMPVWKQEDIQQATTDIDTLVQLLRQYQLAMPSERPAILTQMEELAANMDEGTMTEYIALLAQIQSLLDSGMTESEIQALFPEIDFSTALEQIAAIQAFLNNREEELPGLTSMFGEALPEEVLKITTDLDMTGAQERWDAFAADPGAITTDAILASIHEDENTAKVQPKVDAFIAKYTEVEEGADKSSLTPDGLLAYVSKYAEETSGVDVSALTPEHVTAIVNGYKELASGADVSTLKPDEITAYISQYIEEHGVDTTGLTPSSITATVMAYEEATGGALTTALTPSDITAMVTKYLEAEGVDVSALSSAQIEGIVTKFSEATDCDRSELLKDFTAYISKYDDSKAAVPTLEAKVGIYGYDLIAYRKFIKDNPIEVAGILKLSEVYENPSEATKDENTKYWKDGVEIPAELVTSDMLTADKVAVLGEDGTMHILITPQVTGTQKAIDAIKPVVDEVDQFGVTLAGIWAGVEPTTTMDMVGSAVKRINSYTKTLDYTGWQKFWASLRGESTDKGVLDQSMTLDFPADRVAELSTYVAEVVAAIQQGKQVSEADITNLEEILTFLQGLDTTETGTHILEGIGVGMTEAGWDSDAETVAANLESALNMALGIQSPSTRVKPTGENVSAGVGVGMSEFDFATDADTVASNITTAIDAVLIQTMLTNTGTTIMEGLSSAMTGFSFASTGTTIGTAVKTAVSSTLTSTALHSIGVNAMSGLAAGIRAGQSSVVSAMKSAAQSAVSAAKKALQIKSPSRVFRDEVGKMVMEGFGEGVLDESKRQGKILRNASRFLTESAKEGAISANSADNRKTYNNTQSVNLTVQNMQVRDEQDIRSLATEIATLTRRQQRGKGLRMT